MRKVLITVCILMTAAVVASAADHRDGPIFGCSPNCRGSVKTYTLGHYPGVPVVALKDLAKAAGATIVTSLIAPVPRGSLFRVEGTKLVVIAGTASEISTGGKGRSVSKITRESQWLAVQCSGEISSNVIRHIGEIWVPVQDVAKALGATYETPLQKARPGQTVRVSIRTACDTCIFAPR